MTESAFGKYEILKKVGMGGMAEVLLARQQGIEGFEKILVIKRVLPHLADSMELIQMLLDEARLAARLNHPNIVQIYDLGRVDGQYFIAMEYVNGVDLSRILKKERKLEGTIPVAHGVKILSYVCEALSYAHNKADVQGNTLGLVHRDISPHNVLVSFEGGVKLTDFGIAKASSHLVKTKAGTLKGKYSYVSPEQCLGTGLDHRSDIFAAGILLYEVTTGSLPFAANSEVEALHNIVYQAPRPATVVREDFPLGLVPILERALAKDPDDRYPDALSLQMALETFLQEERMQSNTTLIGQYVRDLFKHVVAAQTKQSGDGKTATVAGILDALEVAKQATSPTSSIDPPIGEDEDIHDLETHLFRTPPGTAGTATTTEQPAPASGTPEPDDAEESVSPSKAETPRSSKTPIFIAVGLGVVVAVVVLIVILTGGNGTGEEGGGDIPDKVAEVDQPPDPTPAKLNPVIDSDSIGIDLSKDTPGEDPDPIKDDPAVKKDPAKIPTHTRPPVKNGKKRKKKRVAAKKAEGFLTLNSDPWSEVWWGKKKLGMTPIAYKKLPSGRHRLQLRNKKEGIRQSVWVRIRPNETTTLMVDLEKK